MPTLADSNGIGTIMVEALDFRPRRGADFTRYVPGPQAMESTGSARSVIQRLDSPLTSIGTRQRSLNVDSSLHRPFSSALRTTTSSAVAGRRRRAPLRGDRGQRLERLDRAQVARAAPPPPLEPVVRPARRCVAVAVVEPLVRRDPRDGALYPRVVEQAQPDQAPHQVACQARDDRTVKPTGEPRGATDRGPTRLGILRITQDRLAPGTHAGVGAVCAEGREDDELPDRPAVHGRGSPACSRRASRAGRCRAARSGRSGARSRSERRLGDPLPPPSGQRTHEQDVDDRAGGQENDPENERRDREPGRLRAAHSRGDEVATGVDRRGS